MTYYTIKKLLQAGNKKGLVTFDKLDIFLLNNRITEDQYNELLKMLEELGA